MSAGFMSDAPAAELQHLFEVLDAGQPGDPIPYQALFLEDQELSQVTIMCSFFLGL